MKKLSIIFLALFISCSAFSDDEEEEDSLIPSSREITRSICIGVLHGGICFGVTILTDLSVEVLFPESLEKDPYAGSLDTGLSGLGQVVWSAALEELFFHITLLPITRSFICNRLNQISANRQRNRLIARHSANLLNAICFGAAHLFNPNPSIFQVFYAALTGYSDGEIYYRFGRVAVITSHVTFNILGFLLMRASLANVEK